jgi:hypothetical protein
LRNFQKAALEAWVQEYRGDLGIALTDVVGMDAFCVILICILPSCLMACVMIVVILMNGVIKPMRIIKILKLTPKPKC